EPHPNAAARDRGVESFDPSLRPLRQAADVPGISRALVLDRGHRRPCGRDLASRSRVSRDRAGAAGVAPAGSDRAARDPARRHPPPGLTMGWTREVYQLPEGHGWMATPGRKILVLDAGAVVLEFPADWALEPAWGQVNVRDAATPDDS